MVAASSVLALVVGEVLLRLIPIPGVAYHTYYFDDRTGGKYYPRTTAIYRNARGDFVERRVNSWGFTDDEHETAPAPGVLRIGFFGDSYTEARQVPLEATFVRLIEDGLNESAPAFGGRVNGRGEPATRVETLNFGMSGRSTLQSFLEYEQWVQRAHLDGVVYVFCENDPGDQIEVIKRSDIVPYAVLDGDSFRVDYSFAERYGYKNSRLHRTWQFFKSNSLVLSTLEGRLKLLMKHGIKMKVTEEDREGGRGGRGPRGVEPSSWPSDSLATHGWELFTRVLDAWRRDAAGRGLPLCVIPIPREKEVGKPVGEQDAWAARVRSWCAAHGVAFVDPNPAFAAAKAGGRELYYDHFTVDGHRAFADAFVQQSIDWLAARAPE
jgi:lysophospholipase L1-like esterase